MPPGADLRGRNAKLGALAANGGKVRTLPVRDPRGEGQLSQIRVWGLRVSSGLTAVIGAPLQGR